jgi:hypothetical protein
LTGEDDSAEVNFDHFDFTDLLYSDTMEDIRLDDLALVETADDSDVQMDDDTLEGVSTTDTIPWDCQWHDLCGDGIGSLPATTKLPGSTCLFC